MGSQDDSSEYDLQPRRWSYAACGFLIGGAIPYLAPMIDPDWAPFWLVRAAYFLLYPGAVVSYVILLPVGSHSFPSSNAYFPVCVILYASVGAWIGFALYALRKADIPEVPTCAKCGYNLTGNVSGVCPECGTAILPGELAQIPHRGARRARGEGKARQDSYERASHGIIQSVERKL